MHNTDDLTSVAHQGGMTLVLRAAARMLGKQTVYDLLPKPLNIFIFDHRSGCQIDIYCYVQGRPIVVVWRGSSYCSTLHDQDKDRILGLDSHCTFARPIIQSFFQQMYSAVAIAFTYTSLRRQEKLHESDWDSESLEYYKSLF